MVVDEKKCFFECRMLKSLFNRLATFNINVQTI